MADKRKPRRLRAPAQAGGAAPVGTADALRAFVLYSGALPLAMIGADAWPHAVPAQLHYSAKDPRKVAGSVESVMESVNAAGAAAEYIQYPGSGHLFTDPSMKDEYDASNTDYFWQRVFQFLGNIK